MLYSGMGSHREMVLSCFLKMQVGYIHPLFMMLRVSLMPSLSFSSPFPYHPYGLYGDSSCARQANRIFKNIHCSNNTPVYCSRDIQLEFMSLILYKR